MLSFVSKAVSDHDSDPFYSWFESLISPLVNAKLFQIRLLKHEKKKGGGGLDCDPPRKPDSEDLWMQSSFV